MIPEGFQRNRRDAGFLELEALLVGAIGLILIFGAVGAISSVMEFQKRADQSTETQLFVRDLAFAIKSEDTCTAALAGVTFPTETTYDPVAAVANIASAPLSVAHTTLPEQPLNLPVTLGGTAVSVTAGFMPSQSLRVKKISLIENSQYGSLNFNYTNGSTVKSKLAVIRIQTERLSDGTIPLALPPKDIPIKVLVDSTGQVTACNITASAQLACDQMGGEWNPANVPADQKCLPKNSCEYGGTYSTAPLNQGGFTNALTSPPSYGCADTSFTPQRTGTVTYASACGKTCVRNYYYPIYTCTRCGSGITQQPLNTTATTSDTADITGAGSTTLNNNFSSLGTAIFGL